MLGQVKSVISGFSAYFKVIPLFSRLKLWRYVLLTALIALGLILIFVPIAYLLGTAIVALIENTWSAQFSGLARWLTRLISLTIALAFLVVFALVFKHILLVASAPWMGKVAERVRHYIAPQELPQVKPLQSLTARSLRLNLRLVGKELLYSTPLLLLTLIPGVNLVSSVALFVVQSFYVGVGALDYSVERDYDYRGSIAFYDAHKGLSTGIGVGFVLLLLTGVGVMLAPAWSAAAGAWAYGQIDQSQTPAEPTV